MILCLLYTLQYRSVRGLICQLQRLRLKLQNFHSDHSGHLCALLALRRLSVRPTYILKVSHTSSHNTIALTRIDLPLLRPHVQIDRTNELEEWIIIRLWLSFFQPLVPPDQQTHEDLDLLQCKVEPNAHPLASGETGFVC